MRLKALGVKPNGLQPNGLRIFKRNVRLARQTGDPSPNRAESSTSQQIPQPVWYKQISNSAAMTRHSKLELHYFHQLCGWEYSYYFVA
jgi:hypothetical protein